MKTILMMATTVNGMVANLRDETPWSAEEFANFETCVERYGNLIVGRRTIEIMAHQGELELTKNAVIVVVSSKPPVVSGCLHVKTPKEALELLKNKGFEVAMVGGGMKLNTAFLQEGLIDELILDVEPFVFGNGIPLVDNISLDLKLELLSCRLLNKSTVALHYRILK